MRNRETDRQADRQTNDVWADDESSEEKKKGGREERGFIVRLQGEAYVPSTSESKEGEDGRVKGRKDRMKKEERRPDQTQAVRAGKKKGK